MSTPTNEFLHTTVLLHEAVDALVIDPDGTYVDGTYGRGGHSRLILERLSEKGRLLAIDRDPQAIAAATSGATRVCDPRFSIHHTSFGQMVPTLTALGVTQVDGLLLDLGVSSPQIDDPERGFSFRFDGPLQLQTRFPDSYGRQKRLTDGTPTQRDRPSGIPSPSESLFLWFAARTFKSAP